MNNNDKINENKHLTIVETFVGAGGALSCYQWGDAAGVDPSDART